ncbi:hypothetical protein LAUMK41_04221 [Mycobacterium attenuatum]|nr:hypothetical protein LAUMK41_04221 [Mycobacterium attenuatum]
MANSPVNVSGIRITVDRVRVKRRSGASCRAELAAAESHEAPTYASRQLFAYVMGRGTHIRGLSIWIIIIVVWRH